MLKFSEYLDKSILNKLGDYEQKEIRKIIYEYYSLKEIESGVNEIELLTLLIDNDLSLEEISERLGISVRQLRRRKSKYINFIIKIIYRYVDACEMNNNVLKI